MLIYFSLVLVPTSKLREGFNSSFCANGQKLAELNFNLCFLDIVNHKFRLKLCSLNQAEYLPVLNVMQDIDFNFCKATGWNC